MNNSIGEFEKLQTQVLDNQNTAVILLTPGLKIGYLNPAAEMLLGISVQRHLGMSLVELFPNNKLIEADNLPSYLFDPVSLFHESRINETVIEKSPDTNEPETWSSIQRKMILDALKKAKGKKSEAAKILGWGRSTLWRKIKQYEIDS